MENFNDMTRFILNKSPKSYKRFMLIIIQNNKRKLIHFGDPKYDNYTIHNNDKRKENYIKRHSMIKIKNGKKAIDQLLSPSWLSMNILWNKNSIQESLNDIYEKYGLHIVNKID